MLPILHWSIRLKTWHEPEHGIHFSSYGQYAALPAQETPFVGPSPPADDAQITVKSEKKPDYSGIYSTSGFDMLGALTKVANRKNRKSIWVRWICHALSSSVISQCTIARLSTSRKFSSD